MQRRIARILISVCALAFAGVVNSPAVSAADSTAAGRSSLSTHYAQLEGEDAIIARDVRGGDPRLDASGAAVFVRPLELTVDWSAVSSPFAGFVVNWLGGTSVLRSIAVWDGEWRTSVEQPAIAELRVGLGDLVTAFAPSLTIVTEPPARRVVQEGAATPAAVARGLGTPRSVSVTVDGSAAPGVVAIDDFVVRGGATQSRRSASGFEYGPLTLRVAGDSARSWLQWREDAAQGRNVRRDVVVDVVATNGSSLGRLSFPGAQPIRVARAPAPPSQWVVELAVGGFGLQIAGAQASSTGSTGTTSSAAAGSAPSAGPSAGAADNNASPPSPSGAAPPEGPGRAGDGADPRFSGAPAPDPARPARPGGPRDRADPQFSPAAPPGSAPGSAAAQPTNASDPGDRGLRDPRGFPRPAGLVRVDFATSRDGAQETSNYRSSLSYSDVVRAYADALQAAGWSKQSSSDDGEMSMSDLRKGAISADLRIYRYDDRTEVYVAVSGLQR